jgi:cytochrome c oxidase assembly protein subunit 15
VKSSGSSSSSPSRGLARFAWGVLVYNVLVVVWGAYVRASSSGAGCGSHWPTCNGDVIPRSPSVRTIVEFAHRTTSGLAVVGIVALLVLTLRATGKGHPARRSAWLSLLFVALEAGIGAGLVLFEWVAGNKSLARGFVMSAHLINTFLLLGALTLTAWYLGGKPALRLRRGPTGALLGASMLAVFLTGASGGIAALGDTLFPATSLMHGLLQDASTTAHVFLKLRVFHPALAVTTAVLLVLSARLAARTTPTPRVRRAALALVLLVGAQVAVGVLDVLLLAPIALQLVHLALADATWIAFVLLAASHAAERSTP